MNKERKKESHIIVALDRMRPEKALELASLLNGKVWGFKANDLLDQMGPEDYINKLSQYGNVMADPKFCDIPNTLKNRMPPYRKANIVTVMACSGKEALRAAIENSGGAKIAAVTVLTSLDEGECKKIFGDSPQVKVLRLSNMAQECGCEYIVCSPMELMNMPWYLKTSVKFINSGIRSAGVSVGDQKRIGTPWNAIRNGASLLVMGREITEAEDPLGVVQRINEEIEKALSERGDEK